jgi:hypothetical protein
MNAEQVEQALHDVRTGNYRYRSCWHCSGDRSKSYLKTYEVPFYCEECSLWYNMGEPFRLEADFEIPEPRRGLVIP